MATARSFASRLLVLPCIVTTPSSESTRMRSRATAGSEFSSWMRTRTMLRSGTTPDSAASGDSPSRSDVGDSGAGAGERVHATLPAASTIVAMTGRAFMDVIESEHAFHTRGISSTSAHDGRCARSCFRPPGGPAYPHALRFVDDLRLVLLLPCQYRTGRQVDSAGPGLQCARDRARLGRCEARLRTRTTHQWAAHRAFRRAAHPGARPAGVERGSAPAGSGP